MDHGIPGQASEPKHNACDFGVTASLRKGRQPTLRFVWLSVRIANSIMRTLARECACMCTCTRVDVCIYGCMHAKPIMASLAREGACMCACTRVDLCTYGWMMIFLRFLCAKLAANPHMPYHLVLLPRASNARE